MFTVTDLFRFMFWSLRSPASSDVDRLHARLGEMHRQFDRVSAERDDLAIKLAVVQAENTRLRMAK